MRVARIGAAAVRTGLLLGLVLAACTPAGAPTASIAQAESSVEVEPTLTVAATPLPTPEATPVPEPTPLPLTRAAVAIIAGGLQLDYEIDGCPVTAWADPAIGDGITFGIYPIGVTANDGREWATQMVVMRITDGVPTDWSFILSTPPGVPSAQNERRLTSSPNVMGMEMSAEITDTLSVFTTAFLDPVRPFAEQLLPGMVTVTCS